MGGLSHLPLEDALPDEEEATLLVQILVTEEAARQAALELHRATNVGGSCPVEALLEPFYLYRGQTNLH